MCSNLTHYVKVEYISMCKTKLHIFNEKQKKIMRVMEILLEKYNICKFLAYFVLS